MHVLLFALGSHGDVHPFVGIGIRLRERGHHVTVAANAYFQPLVAHAKLNFISLASAEEYRRLAMSRDLWNPLRSVQAVFNGTARYLRPMYDAAVEFCRTHNDGVIAASTLALGARVAQDKFDLPLASVHLAPSIFQSAYDPPNLPVINLMPRRTPIALMRLIYRGMNAGVDSMIAPAVNALRNEVGLPPVGGVVANYWHSPRLTIGLFPEWFGAPQPDWPANVRLTGFPLFDEPDMSPMSDELFRFLDDGEPPIAFTPGSAMWTGERFFQTSVQTCVRLNRRGLLLTRRPEQVPARLPPGVIHVNYAPFSHLLPRCAAFVHHAGIGSSAQALAAGVRQLLTPFTYDQPDNAGRLKRLGVAQIVGPAKYQPGHAARVLRELIESKRIASACRNVAERFIGVDSIGRTCDLIETL